MTQQSRNHGTGGATRQDQSQTFDNQTPYSPGSAYIDIHHRSIQSAYGNRTLQQLRRTPSLGSTEEPLPARDPSLDASTAGINATPKDDLTQPKLLRVSTTFYDRILTDWWWWELFSWLVAFMCVAAIVGVLAFYDGKRQPDFIVPGVTLNAYVSVFAAIAKAALILPVSEAIGQLKWMWFQRDRKLWDFHTFDGASRGPWGSLMLLSTTKCKHLVSLGAAITIMALAFEPFFQQIVSFPSRDIGQGPSKISVARSYGTDVGVSYIADGNSLISNVANGLQVALVDAAISRNGSVKPAPSICPTGRCNWTSYDSLGVCHQCQDVSNLLEYICKNHTSSLLPYGGASNPCGWQLNSSWVAGDSGSFRFRSTTGLSTIIVGDATPQTATFSSGSWNSTVFADAENPILDFYLGFIPGAKINLPTNATPTLVECLFSWCVKTFQSSHESGVLTEAVMSTFSTQSPTPGNVSRTKYESNPVRLDKEQKAYSVSTNATALLGNAIRSLFPRDMDESSVDEQGQYPGEWSFVQNTPYDVNPFLAKIASAVTNNMRSQEKGTEVAVGKAWGKENFVEIRWAWFSLPGFVLLSSLVFVSTTVFRSRRQKFAAWKSSSLATLLHGMTEEARVGFAVSTTPSEVEAMAHECRVTLSDQDGKTMLVLV
ncbi:hypothetical protein BDV96DRAFT_492941 [Lophiotrema nucula]|uniref:Uncharacterized protein n=1 Tax=Lophiotrema nucula TaxID=690887 RepID=A0A6A5Z9N1_9PLEO|nr:hypothetical protein BDV96DRAFT_492941 [Lophiotrema nucula]